MWIMTQTKHTLINTDQIASIWADRTTCAIRARVATSSDNTVYTLGTYATHEVALSVLEKLYLDLGDGETVTVKMPLGGEV